MIGYKAFDKNLCCRGFQFEVGKTYKKDVKKEYMRLCTDRVFHFCRDIHEIERNSSYKLSESRICEVISGEDVIGDNCKFGTNEITILREITGEEKQNLCNSGYRNSGYRNSGDRNSGDWNSGNWNSGYLNSTDDDSVRIFNKITRIKKENIVFPEFFFFNLTQFVSYDTATDEERKKYKKEIETCGGFLKTLSYKDAWRRSWENADENDRRKVLCLPNWDNEVFIEITGIDVEKELDLRKK